MSDLFALPIVVQFTRDEVRSGAPVVGTRHRSRARTAMALRRLADHVDATGRRGRPRPV